MKKTILSCLAALFMLFIGVTNAQADNYLRVGMEAAYAPFNWTQDNSSNGAVPIEGTKQYANGYDVQTAKKIAKTLGKKPLIVKTKWEGLVPALTSGKIDLIIAGMSPTKERKKEIAFSNSYYTSEPVLVVRKDSKYAKAKNLNDFSGAKVTSQQGVYLYNLINQIPKVSRQTAMGDFSQMRQALASNVIDAYVSERPEALSSTKANSNFKMVSLKNGFKVSKSDVTIAVGMRKGDPRIEQVNAALDQFPLKEQISLMDKIIPMQPSQNNSDQKKANLTFSTKSAKLSKTIGKLFFVGQVLLYSFQLLVQLPV